MTETKCVVNAKEFQKALEKVLKVALKKSSLPFLLEAHVKFDGTTCTLSSTSLELWCQVSIPAQGGKCAFVLTDSRKLSSVCKYFSGELEFFYQEDQPPAVNPQKTDLDGTLTLRCENKELRQRVTTTADFPEPPNVAAEHTYNVDTDTLSKRFERIKYALSTDTSRPCYCCVKFFDNRIGAVDGYRLALNRDESLCVDEPFYISPGALKLLSIFDGKSCRLLVGKNRAVFDSGDVRLITRLPEGKGLDFDAAIPKDCGEVHTVDIPDFVGSLRYLSEFIRNPDKDPICFDSGYLSLKNVRGKYISKLKMDDVPQTVIGFKVHYMLDGLKQFQSKKLNSVSMQMSTPSAPIVLKDQDDFALILPFRLKKAA